MTITLDEHHVYRVNGEIKPGVTQILDFAGLIPQWCKDEFAAQRGDAIHAGCALLFQGLLDWDSVDSRIEGYLRSLDTFIKVTGFKAISVETQGYCAFVDYCGTWDVTGLFPNDPTIDHDWVLDLKSGAPAKWHKSQTAPYQVMAKTKHRGCLYLYEDGNLAKLIEHKDPNDWRAFYSAFKKYQAQKIVDEETENLRKWT